MTYPTALLIPAADSALERLLVASGCRAVVVADVDSDIPMAAAAVIDARQVGVAAATTAARHVKDAGVSVVLLVVHPFQLADLSFREEIIDDFVLHPINGDEFTARLRHRFTRAGEAAASPHVTHGQLSINTETYQATIAGRALDLTYMEYELLRFLAAHPDVVFTRETLLSRVWGYEYYGGARTVDVHVRRLRAKLGEEHAGMIQTLRSVGYRFSPSGLSDSDDAS